MEGVRADTALALLGAAVHVVVVFVGLAGLKEAAMEKIRTSEKMLPLKMSTCNSGTTGQSFPNANINFPGGWPADVRSYKITEAAHGTVCN